MTSYINVLTVLPMFLDVWAAQLQFLLFPHCQYQCPVMTVAGATSIILLNSLVINATLLFQGAKAAKKTILQQFLAVIVIIACSSTLINILATTVITISPIVMVVISISRAQMAVLHVHTASKDSICMAHPVIDVLIHSPDACTAIIPLIQSLNLLVQAALVKASISL